MSNNPRKFDKTDPEQRMVFLGRIYESMVKEMQEFRALMAQLLAAILGLMLFFVGWIASYAKAELTDSQRLTLSIGPFMAGLIGIGITAALHHYFSQIALIIAKIDDIHGTFDKDLYVPEDSLFPKKWRNFGTLKNWFEPIFTISYVALFATCTVVLIVIQRI
jgi:hypothetical protein